MKGRQVWRKLFHFSGIVIPVSSLAFGRTAALVFCGVLLATSVVLEVLRLKGYVDLHVAKPYLKSHEARRPTGSFFFLVSSLLTLVVFEGRYAVPALFVLSISDPCSSYVGQHFGRTPLFGKSLEGFLAFLFSACVIMAFFPFPLYVSGFAAAAAAFTELFSSRYLDDNLTIPIVTAGVLWLLA